VQVTNNEGVYDLLVNYRSGDMWAPRLEQVEALRMELAYFVDCIANDQNPFNDGHAGLRVVKMLEAASQSLRHRGASTPTRSLRSVKPHDLSRIIPQLA
jgi:hypothetical protein